MFARGEGDGAMVEWSGLAGLIAALLLGGCGQASSPEARRSLAAGAGIETALVQEDTP